MTNLECTGSNSPASLTLSWEDAGDQSHSSVRYRVEVLRIQHKQFGSREQESVPLMPAYSREVMETQSQVTHGLGMHACISTRGYS